MFYQMSRCSTKSLHSVVSELKFLLVLCDLWELFRLQHPSNSSFLLCPCLWSSTTFMHRLLFRQRLKRTPLQNFGAFTLHRFLLSNSLTLKFQLPQTLTTLPSSNWIFLPYAVVQYMPGDRKPGTQKVTFVFLPSLKYQNTILAISQCMQTVVWYFFGSLLQQNQSLTSWQLFILFLLKYVHTKISKFYCFVYIFHKSNIRFIINFCFNHN